MDGELAKLNVRKRHLMRVAVVGAGIAGLACAGAISEAGDVPTLFEKAPSIGGRMATRHAEVNGSTIGFDLGATHFTARSSGFKTLVADWQKRHLAEPWPSAGLHAWVGTPTMSAPLEDLAGAHDIHLATSVTAITRHGGAWAVYSERERFGPFDAVVLAIPAELAAPLLSLHDFEMARLAMSVTSRPVWSAWLVFPERIALPDFLRGPSPMVAALRSNARPGRHDAEHWIVQADWSWSEHHFAQDARTVASALLGILAEAAGSALPEPVFADAHRWRFAQPSGSELGHLWNGEIGLGACGDWLSYGFIEHAWQSGRALGDRIAGSARASTGPRRN
jgi:hypothetical protein